METSYVRLFVLSAVPPCALFEGVSLRPFQEPSPAWFDRGDFNSKYLVFGRDTDMWITFHEVVEFKLVCKLVWT